MNQRFYLLATVLFFIFACEKKQSTCKAQQWTCIDVKASAYNSLVSQTSSNPFITAFGDSIKPGDKYIAVSRDLLNGPLTYNTKVIVQGLDSIWVVKDKMNRRYSNTIDIYMGYDVKKAREWGRKKIKVCYKTDLLMDDEK